MLERIKEYDQEKRLPPEQSSVVSEHSDATGHYPPWDEVTKFIDPDPCWSHSKSKQSPDED